MKTISLALCAAAVIMAGATEPAAARKHTGIVNVSIDGFCNVETITIGRASTGNTIVEANDGCDENFGTGLFTKIKGSGQFANFALSSATAPGVAFDMVFTKPFATDGTGQVSLLYTADGVNQTVIGPYGYTVVTGAKPGRTGLKSVMSLVPRK